MQVFRLPVCSLTSYNIKAYNPCRLVQVNSNCRAKKVRCLCLCLHRWTGSHNVLQASRDPRTPHFLQGRMAHDWPSILLLIGGSNYHPAGELDLPVSPRVPNNLFARHLWGNERKKGLKIVFHWADVLDVFLQDIPVESLSGRSRTGQTSLALRQTLEIHNILFEVLSAGNTFNFLIRTREITVIIVTQ